MWPALSPDGKQVAVARLVRTKEDEKTHTLQVIIYDLAGKEVHRSKDLPWTNEGKGGDAGPMGTEVYWAASAGKLVVGNLDDLKTGIYDLTKKLLVTLDGTPAAFGGSPVRPDGKGFLITRRDDGPESLKVLLVDWDGKAQPIDMKPDTIDADSKSSSVQFPWAGTSGWKGQVAEVSYGTSRIRIDTEKRVGTFEAIPKAEGTVDEKDIVQQYAFPNGARVRVLAEQQNNQTKYQLEFLKAGEKQPKVVSTQEKNSFVLSPSPDRKWVAARVVGDDKTIFLMDAKGDVKQIAGSNVKGE
jgi:Tol biopolymer transport system component